MVSIEAALEGDYVNADLVKASKTKKFLVVDGGGYEKTTFGERLTISVNIDAKLKKWTPSRDSLFNLGQSWGKDTKDWIGQIGSFKVEKNKGKEVVVGTADVPKTEVINATAK